MAREQHQSKLEMEVTTLAGSSLRDALVVRWRVARLFRISPDRLEGYVLWTTIPWFWRWPALVMVWNSNWLREDRKLIASCLSTTSLEDCLLELIKINCSHRAPKDPWMGDEDAVVGPAGEDRGGL
jgi:hypothetical protein